jgi:hypothetical protein
MLEISFTNYEQRISTQIDEEQKMDYERLM